MIEGRTRFLLSEREFIIDWGWGWGGGGDVFSFLFILFRIVAIRCPVYSFGNNSVLKLSVTGQSEASQSQE